MAEKLVALIYDASGELLRVVVSDDYADEAALEQAHKRPDEGIVHVRHPDYQLAAPVDIERFVSEHSGKPVPEQKLVPMVKTEITPEIQKEIDAHNERLKNEKS